MPVQVMTNWPPDGERLIDGGLVYSGETMVVICVLSKLIFAGLRPARAAIKTRGSSNRFTPSPEYPTTRSCDCRFPVVNSSNGPSAPAPPSHWVALSAQPLLFAGVSTKR